MEGGLDVTEGDMRYVWLVDWGANGTVKMTPVEIKDGTTEAQRICHPTQQMHITRSVGEPADCADCADVIEALERQTLCTADVLGGAPCPKPKRPDQLHLGFIWSQTLDVNRQVPMGDRAK